MVDGDRPGRTSSEVASCLEQILNELHLNGSSNIPLLSRFSYEGTLGKG